MPEVFNVLMVGVGGQGIVLASDMLAEAAMLAGCDAKKSEIHGMSQRGGPVFSHVRFGDRVHSPVIPQGEAHVLYSLEPMELLRWTAWARPDATATYVDQPKFPAGVRSYPAELGAEIERIFATVIRLDPRQFRGKISPKVRNVALLGVVGALSPIPREAFTEALRRLSPAGSFEINQLAFELGHELAATHVEPAHVE